MIDTREVILAVNKQENTLITFEDYVASVKNILDEDARKAIMCELLVKKYGSMLATDKEIDNIKILDVKYHNITGMAGQPKVKDNQYLVWCEVYFEKV